MYSRYLPECYYVNDRPIYRSKNTYQNQIIPVEIQKKIASYYLSVKFIIDQTNQSANQQYSQNKSTINSILDLLLIRRQINFVYTDPFSLIIVDKYYYWVCGQQNNESNKRQTKSGLRWQFRLSQEAIQSDNPRR
ncbi:Hypothetical_protein [Hexamita inflata]|uniref:Hypothetical_protein n=1 Tax=Hexamita inflata TaxID=28002 RepID=A0AA86Q392_9EUKA|nr:Hypothetical protein HINF_LOCUS38766 [Hexamita inflata]